jgi:hypothetical protein
MQHMHRLYCFLPQWLQELSSLRQQLQQQQQQQKVSLTGSWLSSC